jgi:hypothetical protein
MKMTAQWNENLILNGKKTSMAFCPPLPFSDSKVIILEDDDPEVRGFLGCSACFREYIGTWEIKDKIFYLSSLEGRYKLSGNSPIFADWVTAILIVPQGEMLGHDMMFNSVFEQDLHIRIEKGIVTKSKTIDNRDAFDGFPSDNRDFEDRMQSFVDKTLGIAPEETFQKTFEGKATKKWWQFWK